MLKKLKPVIDLPGGSPSGWIGFHFKEVTTPPTNAMSAEESEVLLLSMEDVIACLGFSTSDNPLTKVTKFPKILEAMAHLAEKRSLDSITPEQKEAADKLMEIMKGEATGGGEEQLEASEAAAQLLAMVAADDTKNPHLLYVDRWITTCCTVLRNCRAPASEGGPRWSESLVVCAASCLADLANNPRSTILCSTRASEIFQCLQSALLLSDVKNRMIYYQACRGLAEVLHPSTWPMNEAAKIPKRLIQRLLELLSLEPQLPLKTQKSAEGVAPPAPAPEGGAAPVTPPVTEGKEEGAAEEEEGEEDDEDNEEEDDGPEAEPVTQEDLIRSQACKVVQFMATSGAADLLLTHEPRIVGALEKIRSTATVEEVVLEADSALMSLWLSSIGFSSSDPQVRPAIAEHLLRALGSEDLMDNHQDCSLALVTATMNPSKAIRDEALSLFGQTLQAHPDLVQILVGHIDDGDSLAHQSMVYFMLHLLEVDMPLSALAGTPGNAALLVASLIATANNERHYAPITALIRLVYHPSSRNQVRPLLTPPALQKLRGIPGGRIQKEVDNLMKALVSTERDPNATAPDDVDLAAAYREDPSLQSMFFRRLVLSKGNKQGAFKRTKSAGDADPEEEGEGDGSQSTESHIV